MVKYCISNVFSSCLSIENLRDRVVFLCQGTIHNKKFTFYIFCWISWGHLKYPEGSLWLFYFSTCTTKQLASKRPPLGFWALLYFFKSVQFHSSVQMSFDLFDIFTWENFGTDSVPSLDNFGTASLGGFVDMLNIALKNVRLRWRFLISTLNKPETAQVGAMSKAKK